MEKKNVLLTGASTGIGRATAIEFAKNGYTVFAGVRSDKDVDSLKGESISTLIPVKLDVTNAAQIEQVYNDLERICGADGLCALINNAGINYVAPFELSDENKIRGLMEVNVFGMINTTRKMLPLLQKYAQQNSDTGAKLINIGSIGGAIGLPWEFSYHVSKFAVLGFSASLRFELAPLGIKVTCIMPGGVKTPIFDKSIVEGKKSSLPDTHPNYEYYKKNLENLDNMAAQLAKNAMLPEKLAKKILKVAQSAHPPLKVIAGVDAKVMNVFVKMNLSNIITNQLVKK